MNSIARARLLELDCAYGERCSPGDQCLTCRHEALLAGGGLCAAQECEGHCGFGRLVGCKAVETFLADYRREEFLASGCERETP